MKAGRELDRIIAEKILGWGPREINPPNIILKWKNPDTSDGYSDETLPEFSQDIAAAWEVVEKFRKAGPYKLVISAYAQDKYWTIKAYHPEGYSKSCSTSALTMPHAICLAALKTIIVS